MNAIRVKRWQGFRVFGIDGSRAYLPDSALMRKEFGTHANQSKRFSMAQMMVCYDVLNQICFTSRIDQSSCDEIGVAIEWVEGLPDDSLTIYDRGYASFTLIYLLTYHQKDFIIRCQPKFNQVVQAFVHSKKSSALVSFPITHRGQRHLKQLGWAVGKDTSVVVRLVKVRLETGETEVLITSLTDLQRFPTQVFKELYFLRWGVETYYDRLKNQLQIEVFTGHKPEAVRQEFYALIFVTNLQTLLISDCEAELSEANQCRKYQHHINYNVTLGLMKNKMVTLFLEKDSAEIYQQLQNKFLKHTEAIRPNRTYKRFKDKNKRRGKYQTWSNYRRAI